jgi:hypothetical protein
MAIHAAPVAPPLPTPAIPRDLLMLAGWVINIVIAEWIVRRTVMPRRVAVA